MFTLAIVLFGFVLAGAVIYGLFREIIHLNSEIAQLKAMLELPKPAKKQRKSRSKKLVLDTRHQTTSVADVQQRWRNQQYNKSGRIHKLFDPELVNPNLNKPTPRV